MPHTLAETADNVCAQLGKTDSNTLAICKRFIRKRYQMIYDSALWKDSLIIQSITTTVKDVILPHHMEHVVGIRMGDITGEPVELQNLFQTDPTIFDRTGIPTRFSFRTPTAALVLPNGRSLKISSDSTADTGLEVIVRGEVGSAEAYETLTLNGTNVIAGTTLWDNLTVLSKPATTGNVTVLDSSSNQLLYLWPEEHGRQHVRIVLHDTPAASVTLMVLAKRRIRALTHDQDTPILRNIDNALEAYVNADMLKWMRQRAKAATELDEATALMAEMRDVSVYQESTVPQVVPASVGEWSRDDFN